PIEARGEASAIPAPRRARRSLDHVLCIGDYPLMELRLDDEGTHTLFGNRDENLRMLEDEFRVKISSRGNEIHVQGNAENVAPVEKLLAEMQDLIEQGYPLKKSDLSTSVRVLRDRPDTNLVDFFTDDAVQAAVRRVVT